MEARLSDIGKALFTAVFNTMPAYNLYISFRQDRTEPRVITINAEEATILSLPWELLHDPTGQHLFRERPRMSIRRKISGATGGGSPSVCKPRSSSTCSLWSAALRAGFLDPRRCQGGARCDCRARARPCHLRISAPGHAERVGGAAR
ncbi:MAG: hypothetical protein R2867_18420 [Caldilineaceae bacterium]